MKVSLNNINNSISDYVTVKKDATGQSVSVIKENVLKARGRVDGILRFSIQWNDIEEDKNDLDAHCIEPTGEEIYYKHKKSEKTLGYLDTDAMCPSIRIGIENITYPHIENLIKGNYEFFVNCHWYRNGKSGFRAEIECGGKIYQYHYATEMKQTQNIKVASVYYTGKKFKIKHFIKPVKIIKY